MHVESKRWNILTIPRRLKRISTPKLDVNRLVKRKWSPTFTFPGGTKRHQFDEEKQPAEATWVNFLETIGISPAETDESSYVMQTQQDIVNGIVPMRWTGGELVAVCSALGFQTIRDMKSAGEAQKVPMPLPMIWSGPPGWIYFRSSTDGCIAEFKRRQLLTTQFSADIHQSMTEFHRRLGAPRRQVDISRRLWQCLQGMSIGNKTLYLGGQDRAPKDKRRAPKQPKISPSDEPDFNIEQLDRICRETSDFEVRDITKRLFPDASGSKNNPESNRILHVLAKCPGLLSVDTNGEFAYIFGLDISADGCQTLDRVSVPENERDHEKYPYTLGILCFGHEVAHLIKQAVLKFVPDGFFFCPCTMLYHDIRSMWKTVRRALKTATDPDTGLRVDELFPLRLIGQPTSATSQDFRASSDLLLILKFINACWSNTYNGHTTYTFDDIGFFQTASDTLKRMIIGTDSNELNMDIVWAMLASPDVFPFLMDKLRKSDINLSLTLRIKVKSVPKTTARPAPISIHTRNGSQRSTQTLGSIPKPKPAYDASYAELVVTIDGQEDETFQAPFMADAQYDGLQVLAAVCHVIVNHFWMKKRWIQSVSDYTVTIPNSVKMC